MSSGWDMPVKASGNDDAWGGGNSANGFETNGHNGFDSGGFGDDNAGGVDLGGGGGGDDRACFNCGETGHQKSECPAPPKPRDASDIICRVCNKQGHFSKDCPDAPPMVCRRCGVEGHMVKECEQPEICKNCGGEGHGAHGCTAARKVDRSEFPDMSPDDAWEKIKAAVKDRELDDAKAAVQAYLKAAPDTTYVQLEEAFRSQDVGLFLIAIEKPYMAITMTNMDLQGNMDKKYTVTYRFSPTAPRPREREVWPKTPEKNLERLKDAGEVVDRGLPKCSNCNELGHISKQCTEEKRETTTVTVIKCYNCDGEGHRVRDCPTPRVDKFACKNCHKSGHNAKECPEPRSAEGVECRKCNEVGHFSKDCPTHPSGPRGCRNCGSEEHLAKECPEPKNMANVQCRNCDEMGHGSRECPKPRDYSRVQCSNCKEMGHTKVRCKKPLVPEDDAGAGNGAGFDDEPAAPAENTGGDAWAAAEPVDAASAW